MSRCLVLCFSKRVTLEQMFAWIHVDLVFRKRDIRMCTLIELVTVEIRAVVNCAEMLYD